MWFPERTSQPSGITIQNSTFGPGGNSDGIQNGSNGTRILNNRFLSIHQVDSGAGVHADAIQLYGSQNTVIRGNLMYDVADCIMAPDGSDHEIVEDNACYSSGQGAAFTFESDNGSTIRHNTLLDTGASQTCDYGVRCGELRLGNKSGDPAGRATIVTDNILAFISIPEGSQTYASEGFNLMTAGKGPAASDLSGTPTYVGGAKPTTYAGFALARGSLGKGNASDGTDRGITVNGVVLPDTTPPDTTIASGPSASTTSTSASFTFGSSESGSTFECKVDADAYGSCTSPKSYSGLSTGQHTFSVRATDAAGNTDASPATQTWTITTATDMTPPDTTMSSGPTGSTNDNTPTFAFTASEPNAVFECRVDAGAWSDCTSPWTTPTLTDGAHSVSVRATDAAGNTEAPRRRGVHGRERAARRHDPAGHDDQFGADRFHQRQHADIRVTASEPNAVFECRVDAGAWSDCTSPWTTPTLADGAHSVRCARPTRPATPTRRPRRGRSRSPAAARRHDPAGHDDQFGADRSTNDSTPTFAFTSSESGSAFECQVDSGAWATCTSPWTTATLADGAHTSRCAPPTRPATSMRRPRRGRSRSTRPRPDTTPNTSTSARPHDVGHAASFAFTSSEPGSTFECKLDAGAYALVHEPQGLQRSRARGRTPSACGPPTRRGNIDASPASRPGPSRATTPPPDRPPAGGCVHLQPRLADPRPGRCRSTPQCDVRRRALQLQLAGRRR